ncbi:sugar phosphate isomerase/epimerase family protein [Bythopirellula polymerisocia]|uniref:D-tagatose 3-epimerase n=1 Tax=Bythopirellula polymerisocia TaxID=2528003 RepID=A0A5C6CJB3_9BACT|nr:sugar phosphate isomerase/epimerase [Bythopirellula polymerisocia]TWU23667.1 D-tagatose 3-epimerase [Bythopirellula polymerisocia]
MKYGLNLLLWTDHLDDSSLPVLESLKKMGYDGVEVPVFQLDEAHYQAWGKRLADLGLECTAVTVRGADENCISDDPAVRSAGVAANKRTLDCCQALGAQVLCGPYHSALGEFSGAGPTPQEWAWGVESMREVADHAGKVNVLLAVEALNRFECYFVNCMTDLTRFVAEVNHPSCKLMYDTFHSNIEEKQIENAIRTCAPHLAHVHISENDRSTPGTGNVRWDATFNVLAETGYDGWLTVEAFGLFLPGIAAATKIWRSMYESEDQLARDALQFMKSNVSKRKSANL